MQRLTLNAIFLIATATLSTGATAQNAYKCGNTYSQTPCPDGIIVDASDQRTRAQKKQADAATGRNARTADAMEKVRLQQEKMDLAVNTPPALTTETATTESSIPATETKKKKKAPEYFTAQVPGQKKKKPNPKKGVGKKDARPS